MPFRFRPVRAATPMAMAVSYTHLVTENLATGSEGRLRLQKAPGSKCYGNIFKRYYMLQKEGQYKLFPTYVRRGYPLSCLLYTSGSVVQTAPQRPRRIARHGVVELNAVHIHVLILDVYKRQR